jgi:coenzyme F420-reducing hydrogenase delta subunit
MIREVFLLRAFEAGSDAVIVLGCPEGTCRFIQGNLRSKKRVERVKKMLDDIGIGARRLNFHNIQHGDEAAVQRIVDNTLTDLTSLGPNPAA